MIYSSLYSASPAFLVIPSITTHSKHHSWKTKIEEIEKHKILTFALFLTGLNKSERFECYSLLKSLKNKLSIRIPCVHAVSDMSEDEYWILHDNFGTNKFNLHPNWEFPLEHYLTGSLRKMIYIENSSITKPISAADLNGFAGLCLDLSHLEESRICAPQVHKQLLELAENTKVGFNHISAVNCKGVQAIDGTIQHSTHIFNCPSQLNYLENMPEIVIGDYCAIELENSISEQMELIQKINSKLNLSINLKIPIAA